jgi:hypothetical protein
LLRAHDIGIVVSLAPQVFESVCHLAPEATNNERYRVLSKSPAIGAVYEELGVRRYLLPIKDDGSAPLDDLRAAYNLLKQLCKDNGETGILVHCQAGISRSVAVVGALIAKSKHWSLERAVQEIAQFRTVSLREEFARGVASAVGVPFEG